MQASKLESNSTTHHYRQLGLLLTLYFAQGLPAGFVTQALPAILRQYHVSLVAIGWSGLILVPWGIKFLWAPLVDRHYSAKWGQARSWILPLQVVAIVILVGIACINPAVLQDSQAVIGLYVALFLLSFIGATQDIATDSLATRLLKPVASSDTGTTPDLVKPLSQLEKAHHKKQGQGNAIQVIGYRSGFILGGGVLLMILDKVGWQISFLLMAGMVAMTTFPILSHKENLRHKPPPMPNKAKIDTDKLRLLTQPKAYIQHHYQYFWSNKEMRAWLGVLFTYKIAEGLSSGMVKPMMVDMGIHLNQIGFWVTILGSLASVLGAMVAGYVIQHFSRFTALLGFNVLQTLTIGLYGVVAYALSQHWLQDMTWLFAINALEHFCASLALVAMLTTIMHYTRPTRAGSDYTIQISLLIGLSDSGHFLSGYLAHHFGYIPLFLGSMAVGCVMLLPILYWFNSQKSLTLTR